jgi:undecaprenyl-diphosphatase
VAPVATPEPITLFEAVIFGVVQGVTEFLPVSSTAHLRILPELLGRSDPGAGFTAVIQLGTVMSIFLFFAKDLWRVLVAWLRALSGRDKDSVDAKMGWAVILGSIPIVVLGVLFRNQIKGEELRSLYVVSGALIGMGVLMVIAEKVGKKVRTIEQVRVKDGIIVGLWQAIALIPGMSRSGSTITGALFAGFDRPTAARFSFLLSVPSIAGAGLYQLVDEREQIFGLNLMPTVVATIVSFIVGYWAIGFLIKFLAKHGVAVFVGYRIILALLLIIFMQLGVLSPVSPNPDQTATATNGDLPQQ